MMWVKLMAAREMRRMISREVSLGELKDQGLKFYQA
jgi:hypothetical protein